MQRPQLSVIVPTWNRAEYLADCLESLQAQDVAPGSIEILVVDDGSTDGTTDVVRRLSNARADPPIRHVRLEHGGVNRPRNAGIEHAQGDVVCFIDDDELAPADYTRRALAELDNPAVLGVGGPTREHPGRGPRTCQRCSLAVARLPVDGRAEVDRLLGGNMVIRRSCFDEVGPFRPDLSGRGDETEWFDRQPRKWLYDDDLFVWHRRDGMSLIDLCRRQYTQGRALPRRNAARRSSAYRPSLTKLGRFVGHGITRRCAKGWLLAAREVGAFRERWALFAGRSGVPN